MKRKHRIGVIRLSYRQKPGLPQEECYPKDGLSELFICQFKLYFRTCYKVGQAIDPYIIYGAPFRTFHTIRQVLTYARLRVLSDTNETWRIKAVLIT
jgi:hypothetical protein